MGVVVDDGDPGDGAADLEPASDTAEPGDPGGERGQVATLFGEQRQHPGGVAGDVGTRRGNRHVLAPTVRTGQPERHLAGAVGEVLDPPGGVGGGSVSDDRRPFGEPSHPRVVDTGHHRAAGPVGDEGECLLELGHGAVVVEVVGFDVGDQQ